MPTPLWEPLRKMLDIEQWTQWIQFALTVHAAASAIVAVTPTPKDDHALAGFYKLIELAALAVGRAKETGK